MDIQKELKEIKNLCILNFAEIQHLKKLILENLDISKDDIYNYANSLGSYINELENKNRNLIKEFSYLDPEG